MFLLIIIMSEGVTTAYATGFEEVAAIGGMIAAPEVALVVLGILGIGLVVGNRDAICDGIDKGIQAAAKESGIAASQIRDFYRQAKLGFIDTGNKMWDITKAACQNWVGEQMGVLSDVWANNNVKVGDIVGSDTSYVIITGLQGSGSSAAPYVGSFTYYDNNAWDKIGCCLYSEQPFMYTSSYFGAGNWQQANPTYSGGYYSRFSLSMSDWQYVFDSTNTIAMKILELIPDLGKVSATPESLGISSIMNPANNPAAGTVANISTLVDGDIIDVGKVVEGTGEQTVAAALEAIVATDIPYEDVLADAGVIAQEGIVVGDIPTTAEIADTFTDADTAEIPVASDTGGVGQFGLPILDIFPFCIPFDIFDFVAAFDASPVAPSVTLGVQIPIVDVPFEYTIDMTKFDELAAVVRGLECLLFLFGLMFITSKMIKW